MQSCSSPGASCRLHLLHVERRSGIGRRGRVSRTGGSDISLPLAPLERLVVWPGCGKRARPGAGRDHRLWCRYPGLRLAPAHRSCFLFAGSARRSGGAAACSQMSVSLNLLHSRLYGQDVAVDAVCGRTFAIRCSRGSFHFVVLGPPSSPFSPPVKDNQHVSGILKSSARKRGLHPSKIEIERMRIANQSAEGTAEVCSIVRSWNRRFSCSASASLPGFSVIVSHGAHCRLARQSQTHRLQAGVSWCPIARSHIGRSTSWKRGSAISGRTTWAGTLPLRVQRRWALARQGCPTTSCSGSRRSLARQRSHVQLTWRTFHRLANKPTRNTNIVIASTACSALTCPCPLSRGTTSLAHVSRLCSMGLSTTFPRLALCLTILAPANRPAALAVSLGPLAPVVASTFWEGYSRYRPWAPISISLRPG